MCVHMSAAIVEQLKFAVYLVLSTKQYCTLIATATSRTNSAEQLTKLNPYLNGFGCLAE